jgi:hypothetical protein
MKNIFGAIIISFVLLSAIVSAQSLKIDDFSIKLNNETEVISVNKDGKVIVNGKQIGVLHADGKLIDLQGKTISVISEQGRVSVNDKQLLRINKDGDLYKEVDFSNDSVKFMGWSWGELDLFGSQFVTVSPNKKEFYQPASFLIFLYLTVNEVISESPAASLKNDKVVGGKFKYKESDLVASVSSSGMRGSNTIRIFGDGRIRVTGEPFEARKVPSDKKQVQAKINLFLQRAKKIDFFAIHKKGLASPFRLVQDGGSWSVGVWQNGTFEQAGCASSRVYCSQKISELHSYFFELFEADFKRKKLN